MLRCTAQSTVAVIVSKWKMGTAPENVALFKKYEADLRKYAMSELHVSSVDAKSKAEPGRK